MILSIFESFFIEDVPRLMFVNTLLILVSVPSNSSLTFTIIDVESPFTASTLSAAIKGEMPDGIPSGFSLHFPADQAVGDRAVEAHLKFFQETDTDIIKIMMIQNK